MPRSFQMGGALQGSYTSPVPIIDCDIDEVSFCVMTRKGLRLDFHHFGKLCFQPLCYARMQLLALAAQQGIVRGLLDECVLEPERSSRRRAATEHEAGFSELVERAAQLFIGTPSNRGEEIIREFSADRGADLRHFLNRHEAVETGH